jgi:DNA-binding NarL/FixJ family response regulator
MAAVERAVLVGRRYELEGLRQIVERAARGYGGAAVVHGEPGIGKTRLVATVLAECRRRGFETFVATAREMEQRRPFGLMSDAFDLGRATDAGRAQVAELLRVGPPGPAGPARRDPDGREFRVAERLLECVEERSLATPVAIAVEDLQWADPSSLVVLDWLARQGVQLPLLIVSTLGPRPLRPEVGSLLAALDSRGALRIDLGPLTGSEVSELVARMLGRPPGARLLEVVAGAGGNPLHIREIVGALRADGALSVGVDDRVEVPASQLPASLRQTVLHRLGGLPETARELLRAASLLGSSFAVGELQTVLSRPETALTAELLPAIDAGVLVATEDGLAFRHELIREAIHEDIAPPLRRARHREIAGLLCAAGAESAHVAAHMLLGADQGDSEAVGWLREAAGATVAVSPAVAVELLQQAHGLCLLDDPVRAEIVRELVQPLALAGRQEELEALCHRALDGEGRPQDEMEFRSGLGHSLLIGGRLREARAAYEAGASSATLGTSERAALRAHAALCGAMSGDPEAPERARPTTASEWGPMTAGISRLALAVAELHSGRADRALGMFDQLAEDVPADTWGMQLLRSAALLDLDEVEEARVVLQQGARDCVEDGAAARAAVHHHDLVMVEYAAGNFDRALAAHHTGLSLGGASGQHWQAISLGLAAAIQVHRGQLDRAARTIRLGEDEISSIGPRAGDHEVARARYMLALALDDVGTAAAAAYEAWERCTGHGYMSHRTWSGAYLVQAALAVGDRAKAEEAVDAAEQAAKVAPAACWQACAIRARGLLDDDPEPLLQAVDLLRASSRPLYLAAALVDAADTLARARRARDARPLAVEALELFASVDASTDSARARRRLRVAGLQLGDRARPDRPRTGWESLSDGELGVVQLVAEGRTNGDIASRLLVTRDTVHAHISSILRKLNLDSRTELTAEAARRTF